MKVPCLLLLHLLLAYPLGYTSTPGLADQENLLLPEWNLTVPDDVYAYLDGIWSITTVNNGLTNCSTLIEIVWVFQYSLSRSHYRKLAFPDRFQFQIVYSRGHIISAARKMESLT